MTAFKKAGWLAAVTLLAGAATVAVKGLHASGLSLPTLARGTDALAAIAALGATGWITFAGLQIVVSVSGVLPASALGIAAGSIYGMVRLHLAAAGSLAGAAAAFGLSRSVFRPWIERLMRNRPHLRRIDAAVQRDGWRLPALFESRPSCRSPRPVTCRAFLDKSSGLLHWHPMFDAGTVRLRSDRRPRRG